MRLLVPISPSRTNDATVEYAVDRVLSAEVDDPVVHLVYVETPGRESSNERMVRSIVDRSTSLARDSADDTVTVTSTHLAEDQYLASPYDHAAVLAAYAGEHDVDRIVLDPGYSVDATDPALQPLEFAFERAGLRYERAEVTRPHSPSTAEVVRFGTTSLLAFGLYLVVSAPWEPFDVATGALVAVVAGVVFRNVAFETTPPPERIAGITTRALLFVPYLLWKIFTANVQISYLVLHPALPIDPHVDRIETALGSGLSVTSLANSLTLTPGTLTIDADRNVLFVHSITRGTRLEVLEGERERAIRFIFYGLGAAGLSGPLERGEVETLSGPSDASELTEGDEDG